VHHCHYEKGNPWDTDNELLMTLCEDCHAVRQLYEDRARAHLGRMFAWLTPSQISDLALNFEEVSGARAALDAGGLYKTKDGKEFSYRRGMETPTLLAYSLFQGDEFPEENK
jgi:hypothetical protein